MAKNLLVLATVALSLSVGTGWAQTSLIPKSDPRLPPQAGQGLPRDDVLFLKKAQRLNTLQIRAAEIATQKAQDDRVKQLAGDILRDHGNEIKRIGELAQSRGVDLQGPVPPHAADRMPPTAEPLGARSSDRQSAGEESSGTDPAAVERAGQEALERLNAAEGEAFDREYLSLELNLHKQIVDLYQTQASNSPDTGLAAFAITSLVPIQRHFDHVRRLGAERGLTIDVVGQPPQY